MAEDRDHPAPARFRAIESAYAEALTRRSPEQRTVRYRFAGRSVVTNVIGERLAKSTGHAFVHLVHDGAECPPVLTADLWEADLDDSFLPEEAPERTWEMVFNGTLLSYAGGRWLEYRREGSITWYDRAAGRIVGWRSSTRPLSVDEFSKPLPVLLWIWYYDQGIQIVHAGLLATDDGAALIGGIGGSGKTTTSIAGAAGGLGFIGDDHVGLERLDDGTFTGYSLYNCVRLAHDNIFRFPDLAAHAYDWDGFAEEKLLIFLSDVYPERLRLRTPITAVVLPRLSGAHTTSFAPARKGEALMRLAPSSVMMPFRSGAEGFNHLSELIRQVPCYWLDLGPDVSDIPENMLKLLSLSAVEAGAS